MPTRPVTTAPEIAVDLAGGPHSTPYRPFRLADDPAPEPGEEWRHEALARAASMGGGIGYGGSATMAPEEQAYARALAGGLPDSPEETVPDRGPKPFTGLR